MKEVDRCSPIRRSLLSEGLQNASLDTKFKNFQQHCGPSERTESSYPLLGFSWAKVLPRTSISEEVPAS